MAIRIIKKDERNSKTIDGVTFFFRRVPSYEQSRLEQKFTKRGVEQKREIVDAVLEYALTGWEGDIDEAFSTDLVKYLPEECKAALIEGFYANDPASALGN